MADQTIVDEAVRLLLEIAPGSKVILFGSHARGQPGQLSDLDFLVVEPKVSNPFEEMVRLRRILDPILRPNLISADVLVVSEEKYNRWKDLPNTVYSAATREGKLYERACWIGPPQ